MIVLGIDPGLATTGWGLVRQERDGRQVLLKFGAVVTAAALPMTERLRRLSAELKALIAAEAPDVAAIEELYIAKNSRTAASVGHGRGVILLTLADHGLAVHEYNPRHVKMALTGYGAADKPQMQRMVQRLLGLKDLPRPDDAADAVAIALCHLNTFRVPLPNGEKVPGERVRVSFSDLPKANPHPASGHPLLFKERETP